MGSDAQADRGEGARRANGTPLWPRTSLLGTLAAPSRERLLNAGTFSRYPADRTLIREGDQGTFVIVLLQGIVKATSLTSDGKEVLLSIRVGGDLIGEFAVLDDGPRSSTVTTCGPVAGRVIGKADFLAVLRRDEVLAAAVNQTVLAKMRSANQRRVEFTGFDSRTRVARVLRELADTYGERDGDRVRLKWPLTQTELASLSSVSEPTLQKALRWLRETDVLTTGYRSITVENFAELSRLAGP